MVADKKPKKRKNQYWLVKVPKYVTEWWWNDEKFPKGSVVGKIKITKSFAKSDTGEMQLPEMALNIKRVSPVDPSITINIPDELKLVQIKDAKRYMLKYGKRILKDPEKKLVFTDRPMFPEGAIVNAVHSNSQSYKKGTIISANHDTRTFNVRFDTGEIQNSLPPSKINAKELPPKVDKCKLEGLVSNSFSGQTIYNEQYKKFLLARQTKSLIRKNTKFRKQTNIFEQRDRQVKIRKLLNEQKKRNAKQNTSTVKIRNVRKPDSVYEQLICTAFDKKPHLTKRELENLTREPYHFLKKVLQRMCNYHQGGPYNLHYSLRDDFL